MDRMRPRDVKTLLEFLRNLYALRGFEAFSAYVGPVLRQVIPSDGGTYSDFDLQRGTVREVSDPPSTEAGRQAFHRHLHEHPLINHYRRTNDAGVYKISDFLTLRQFRRLGLYSEFIRPFVGTERQLACTFQASPSRVIAVAVMRQLLDFSERERLTLSLLRPHLVQASENARVVDRMALDLDRCRRGLEALDRGLIFLGRDGQVRLATSRATAWIETYFERRALRASRLPDALRRWVEAQAVALVPNGALVVERGDRRLIVRLVSDSEESVLLLEEQRTPEPAALERLGLSRREAEVLAWVVQGKTNAEVATLLVARTRTVEKHLERIYRKLGVETRTAAAAAVRAAL